MIQASTSLQKRSLRIAGHRTSVALEREFWATIDAMAKARLQTVPVFIAAIAKRAKECPDQSLASALRVAALNDCKVAA